MAMDKHDIDMLVEYYTRQGGSGSNYFYTPYEIQRGSGVGSFLSGLYRGLIPMIKKTGRFLAPHVAETAKGVFRDVLEDPSAETFRKSTRVRGINSLEKMSGSLFDKMRGGKLGLVRKKKTKKKTTTVTKKKNTKSIKGKATVKKASVKRKTSTRKKRLAIDYPFFK